MRRILTLVWIIWQSLTGVAIAQSQYQRLQDGDYVEVTERVVTYSQYDFIYLGSANRTSGVRAQSQGSAMEGNLVSLYGFMSTTETGEREVVTFDGTVWEEGFPLPRPLGLNIKSLGDKCAPSEQLVRVWGKVAESTIDPAPEMKYYILGGGPQALDRVTIFDPNHDHLQGDSESIAGILTKQIDSETGKLVPKIYQSYDGFDLNMARGSDRYTLSGTITVDSDAAGKKVTIATDSGQTSCVLDANGVGTYQLTLPEGPYTVSAELPGYSTCTKGGLINLDIEGIDFNWFERISCGAVLSPYQRVGVGTSTMISGWYHDAEARSMPNTSVPWTASDGQFGTANTDTSGNFQIPLKVNDRKVVTLSVGDPQYDWKNDTWVQFANPGDPTLVITWPVNDQVVSGIIPLSIDWQDTQKAGGGGSARRFIKIDDKIISNFHGSSDGVDTSIDTSRLSNGRHKIVAWVVSGKGIETESNEVWVDVENVISEISLNQTELFLDDPNHESINYKATVNDYGSYSIEVSSLDGTVVFSQSGEGPGPAQISWDGLYNARISQGIYRISMTFNSADGWSIRLPESYFTISMEYGTALICGKVRGESEELRNNCFEEMGWVMDACLKRHVPATMILDPFWATDMDPDQPGLQRRGMTYWLGKKIYRHFFLSTHGGNIECEDGVWRTAFEFADGRSVFYSNLWVDEGARQMWEAFTDLNLTSLRWGVIQINACNSAGSWEHNIDYGWKIAFGLRDDEQGGVFLGYTANYRPLARPVLWAFSPNGAGWTKGFWNFLGRGFSVNEAIYHQALNIDPTTWGWMSMFLYVYGDTSRLVTWLD